MMKAGVKLLKPSMVWMMALKNTTGVSSGSVIFQKMRQRPAPSMLAAS